MAKYKVQVIKLLLKNNKIAKMGDLVDEEVLTGTADTLAKNGYVKKATKEDLQKAKDSTEEDDAKAKTSDKAKDSTKGDDAKK